MRANSKRCDICNYTYSDKLGCCPPELNRLRDTRTPVGRVPTVFFTDRRTLYSRTCPVRLRYQATGHTIEGLAIIDDQSSITFMDPEAAERLRIPSSARKRDRLSNITVQGLSQPEVCWTTEGLSVSPLLGGIEVPLPRTTILHQLPNSVDEVPSPDEVALFPGLEQYAVHFPQKDPSWETILVIGRDCMIAQMQEQYTSNRNSQYMVAKTPLWWVAMGSVPTGRENPR